MASPQRILDLTIISAEDLTNGFSIFNSKIKSYVVVSLSNQYQQTRTPVDKTGNKNPRWNFATKFTLNDVALHHNQITLHFRIFSRRSLLPDSLIGEVHVSASDLLSSVGKADAAALTHVSYQIRKKNSKKLKGVFNFSYKFGEVFTPAPPPPPPTTGYSYPYPYSYPPPAGTGYPYPASAYPAPGYQQQAVRPSNGGRNNLGMGMLGGALAGFMVGDLISDMGHGDGGYYDGGGYDDGGGFDGGFDF